MNPFHVHDHRSIVFCVIFLLSFDYTGSSSNQKLVLRNESSTCAYKKLQRWHEDCNVCHCDELSLEPICTSMICIQPQQYKKIKSQNAKLHSASSTAKRLLLKPKRNKKITKTSLQSKLNKQNPKSLLRKLDMNEQNPIKFNNPRRRMKMTETQREGYIPKYKRLKGKRKSQKKKRKLTYMDFKWLNRWEKNCKKGSRASPPGSKCTSCFCYGPGVTHCTVSCTEKRSSVSPQQQNVRILWDGNQWNRDPGARNSWDIKSWDRNPWDRKPWDRKPRDPILWEKERISIFIDFIEI